MAEAGESVYIDFNAPTIITIGLVVLLIYIVFFGGWSVVRNFMGGSSPERTAAPGVVASVSGDGA